MKKEDIIFGKVKNYIIEKKLMEGGEAVVVGVSGGADSVCLLMILAALRKEFDLNLKAVHVNHLLRVEASDDAKFTEKLCRDLGIEFSLKLADVNSYVKEYGVSSEEAGRILRYSFFKEEANALKREGIKKVAVATAHHMGDAAETVLLNLFRGSGLKGLTGILPISVLPELSPYTDPISELPHADPLKMQKPYGLKESSDEGAIPLIRPILCLGSSETKEYLLLKGLGWCKDKTNDEDDYTRNRIRHHIIPFAEKEVCERAGEHIYNTSVILSEAAAFIEKEKDRALSSLGIKKGEDIRFSVKALGEMDPFIIKEVLISVISMAAGKRKDIGLIHVEALWKLCFGTGNGSIDLPYGIKALKEYDSICLFKNSEKTGYLKDKINKESHGRELNCIDDCDTNTHHILKVPGRSVSSDGAAFETRVFIMKEGDTIPKKGYTKWFDYDRIKQCDSCEKRIIIRKREAGDFIMLGRDGGKKTLSKLMKDEKIPSSKRDSIPIISIENHVIWAVGIRNSAYFHVDKDTRSVLEIRYFCNYSE